MHILIRTDLGLERIINTDDIMYVDSLNKHTSILEISSKPGFEMRIGMGISDFLRVMGGEYTFSDLYVDQGYQKTIENSSEELGSLEFKEETKESLERLEEFKEEIKPQKAPPTFSKKKENDIIKEEKKVVDKSNTPW